MSTNQQPIAGDASQDTVNGRVRTLFQSDLKPGGRFLVVGDIHGELDLFKSLLAYASYDPTCDVVIALGDLIDRGPQSAETCRWFLETPMAFSLLGNHEAMMLEAQQADFAHALWRQNGGSWSLKTPPDDLDRCLLAARLMPLTIELHLADGRRIGLVHAEVQRGKQWSDARLAVHHDRDGLDDSAGSVSAALIWGRTRFRSGTVLYDLHDTGKRPREWQLQNALTNVQVPGIDLVIAGHTILYTREPGLAGNCLWIDTGAFQRGHGGRLTLVDPIAGHYWQAGHGDDGSRGPLPFPRNLAEDLPS